MRHLRDMCPEVAITVYEGTKNDRDSLQSAGQPNGLNRTMKKKSNDSGHVRCMQERTDFPIILRAPQSIRQARIRSMRLMMLLKQCKVTSGFVYTRIGNPTVQAFEEKLAALEGAEAAVAFASGMAAISAVFLELLRPGDEVISCSQIYGGTRGFYEQILSRTKCTVRHFSAHEDIKKKIPLLVNRKTRLVFFETPSNPELSIIDMESVSSIARNHGLFSVIDNTFATPYLQQPLAHGIDCVVHSATKYIGGHGRRNCGIVAGKKEFVARLRKTTLPYIGGCLSPFNAWLYLRGLKTLHLRMDYHCRSAAAIADFLSRHRKVRAVLYPGLPGHPGHDIAKNR